MSSKTEVKLIKYDAACRAIGEAKHVDEVKRIRDVSVAMKAYARQANNHEMEADAVEIRMRATRRMDQMRREQAQTIGLAKGGGGKHGRKRVAEKPTLKDAGINKNLAQEGRKLGALSDQEFEQKITEARDAVASVPGKIVKAITLPRETTDKEAKVEITLEQWHAMSADERRKCLDRRNFPSDVRFNKQDSDGIDWAQHSWTLVPGCKHSCELYCWAHDTSIRFPKAFPHGFAPVFRPRMLNAPYNTPVPKEAATDARYKNVFVNSMGDLFGRWVPREIIEAIIHVVRENPQWTFLFLTKFPKRMAEFDFPPNCWLGATVDLQVRVRSTEAAFAKLRDKGFSGTLWTSVEPMLEPIRFTRIDLINWIVIGGAAQSMRTPEFRPPFEWIMNLVAQARAANVKIFMKTNLLGNRILELPIDAPIKTDPMKAPDIFNYLKKSAARDDGDGIE